VNLKINIDNEKAAIEKMNKAIIGQRQKITVANEHIADFEKQIAETEQRIEELQAFLNSNTGK
jgi:peptidoglycan hydrolase CwlO-like protein